MRFPPYSRPSARRPLDPTYLRRRDGPARHPPYKGTTTTKTSAYDLAAHVVETVSYHVRGPPIV